MKKLELLAPAKDYASAIAGVDHGADAIYIGGSSFGARKAAANSVEDIAKVVDYAHGFGVRVYATFNTVIFDDELHAARQAACELVEAGVDALIIQDMAVARMGLPVELHASTQKCNMTPEGVKFLEELGFSRVVLERALSKERIAEISRATTVEIEGFVHGAICVGHSGRCLLSRSMSSRSGNRGECSQSCRMTYDLCDERGREIIRGKHLLSVKDLDLSQHIGEMIDAGVSSFKIEGRLKEISYTKNIVAYYRQLLDQEIAHREGYTRSSCGVSMMEFTPNPAKSFSRGGCEYLFDGQAKELASFDTPKSMGEPIGVIAQIKRAEAFRIEGDVDLGVGDGVCFITPEGLKGTNINHINGGWIYPNRMDSITKGATIYRNFDKKFSDSVDNSRTRRRVSVRAKVLITESCATLTYIDEQGYSATTTIVESSEPAQNPHKMLEVLHTQISKSGDTIFEVERVEVHPQSESFFTPSRRLATLRRDTLAELLHRRKESMAKGGRWFHENKEAVYPHHIITAEEAVTNNQAAQLYTDHGVESIARSWECAPNLVGAKVMESSYCLRHEIGECLKEGTQLRGELFLHHGAHKFRLEFDCARCKMNIYKV
ncbi:MAG: U32 family peptidase [Rikenellaceae bacterium]